MPKKKRKQNGYEQSAKEFENLGCLLAQTFVAPAYRIPKALISRDTIKEYKHIGYIIFDVCALGLFLFILFSIGYMNFMNLGHRFIFFAYIAYGIIGIILIALIIRILRIRRHREFNASVGINIPIDKALGIMDKTAKWYNDENVANQELASTLKALNFDAVYGYGLPNGRTVDVKVGDVLIEGKLSPNTAEVDRLIGQLSDYTRYGSKLNVVIYGKLENEARRRIENEIHARYSNQVFLTYLNNPKRLRAGEF